MGLHEFDEAKHKRLHGKFASMGLTIKGPSQTRLPGFAETRHVYDDKGNHLGAIHKKNGVGSKNQGGGFVAKGPPGSNIPASQHKTREAAAAHLGEKAGIGGDGSGSKKVTVKLYNKHHEVELHDDGSVKQGGKKIGEITRTPNGIQTMDPNGYKGFWGKDEHAALQSVLSDHLRSQEGSSAKSKGKPKGTHSTATLDAMSSAELRSELEKEQARQKGTSSLEDRAVSSQKVRLLHAALSRKMDAAHSAAEEHKGNPNAAAHVQAKGMSADELAKAHKSGSGGGAFALELQKRGFAFSDGKWKKVSPNAAAHAQAKGMSVKELASAHKSGSGGGAFALELQKRGFVFTNGKWQKKS